MIAGTIHLSDVFGNLSDSKTYKGKEHRKTIIKNWSKIYPFKHKAFFLSISPDVKQKNLRITGYVNIVSENFTEGKFFKSTLHRDQIIEEIVDKYKLENYSLEITPYL
jgi:hypothetical protein